MRPLHLVSVAVILVLMISASACSSVPPPAETIGNGTAAETTVDQQALPEETTDGETATEAATDSEVSESEISENEFENLEDFDPTNFDEPTNIDNEWFPLESGTQWIYEGITEEGGERIPHRVIFTVTDLTKVIGGVRTIVVWDQDYSAGVLEETELALFAQDNDGNVWHLGQYPEEYQRGQLVEAPAWIHGFKGARAGISMKAEPQLGTSSYSQGWGPAVDWTDRARVAEVGIQTCVPVDCYEDVLVTEEFSRGEPGAFQLKYYARGVGNVRVGWRGDDATKETLELVEVLQLSPEALVEVRTEALALEKRAYEISKEVYDQTPPAEQIQYNSEQ